MANEYIPTKRTFQSVETNYHTSFEVKDSKGRMVGAEIRLCEETYEVEDLEDCPGKCVWWQVPAGHYFVLNVHATRDGRWYGAVQHSKRFATPELREQAVQKYLTSARKRAQRLFGVAAKS